MGQETILIGLQLSGEGAQLTWHMAGMREPQTLRLPGETADGMVEVPPQVWRQILAAPSPEQEEGGGTAGSRPLAPSGKGSRHGQLSEAAGFIKKLLNMVPRVREQGTRQVRVCVTVPSLTGQTGKNLFSILRETGISEHCVCLQDYRTSFFYYVVNKKKELWNGDVAFLMEKDGRMSGWILHIDRSVSPWTASLHEEASQDVSDRARGEREDGDWDRERDRLLYELRGKLFERRSVTASYLYGSYFSGSWAKRSFQYLTFHRHAFQGQNLFSKGACFGAMARAGRISMPDILFLGADMVAAGIGIHVRVRGRNQYLPLVRAGESWYEAHGECEIVPEAEKNITVLSGIPGPGPEVNHVLRLDHFPDRPDRATRLRLSVWFSSPAELVMEAEDLGFGSMYPATGRVWRRKAVISGGGTPAEVPEK